MRLPNPTNVLPDLPQRRLLQLPRKRPVGGDAFRGELIQRTFDSFRERFRREDHGKRRLDGLKQRGELCFQSLECTIKRSFSLLFGDRAARFRDICKRESCGIHASRAVGKVMRLVDEQHKSVSPGLEEALQANARIKGVVVVADDQIATQRKIE